VSVRFDVRALSRGQQRDSTKGYDSLRSTAVHSSSIILHLYDR
jgi:hypothetical protein